MSDYRPVIGGGAATESDVARTKDVLAASREELPSVRAAASKWQGALVVLTGGVAALGLVKSRTDIAALAPPWHGVCGIALGTALLASLIAGLAAGAAAFGIPVLAKTRNFDVTKDSHERAMTARTRLRVAIVFTTLSVLALGATAGVLWYAPQVASSPGLSVVEQDGRSLCGTVNQVTPFAIELNTSTGLRTVPFRDLEALDSIASCPST